MTYFLAFSLFLFTEKTRDTACTEGSTAVGFHSRFSSYLRCTNQSECFREQQRYNGPTSETRTTVFSCTVHSTPTPRFSFLEISLQESAMEVANGGGPGPTLELNRWRGIAHHGVVVWGRAVALQASIQHGVIQTEVTQNRLFALTHGLLRQGYDAQRSPSQRFKTL